MEENNNKDNEIKRSIHKVYRKFRFLNYINNFLNHINKNFSTIVLISLILILVFSIISVFSLSIAGNALNVKADEIKEANKPTEIKFLTIRADNCPACFDIDLIIDSVKEKNVKVLEEETLSYNNEKARQLILEYEIDKLPSLLIFGEIDKIGLSGFEKINDALVFTNLKPLYVDVSTKAVIGQVELINIIDSSCDKCVSLSSIVDSLGQAGVKITDYKSIEYNSAEGKELISKFGIKKVPALLISEDIDYYDDIRQGLAQLELQKKQGYYVLHSTFPPYRDLTTNKIEGLVNLIMLEDSSCSQCYDVSVNKQILQRLGVFVNKEDKYDVNSAQGKQLISKYNIEKVPIIILSPEASVYDAFVQAWQGVGTKEDDGWYVMRKPEFIGTSKDLTTNELIKNNQGEK